ncbi:transposase [Mycolicibacterium sp. 120266]|uniref:transposase n=1 Tax=Mycolicibacterium sp. 120266 TaxID=3090601 RepID=UPI00299EF99C|nr:transposase [Mycolicibacterium sp. 120266]MDX1873680.1 transposase [Mycolicibacterium sp. 120266]
MALIWGTDRGEHLARHGVTIAQAEEAMADPERVVFTPDYKSKSGRSIRTIGFSRSFGDLLAVFTVQFEGAVYGLTAFRADKHDRGHYIKGGE